MRVAFTAYVNLDPQPYIMHTPQMVRDVILATLNNRMAHYRPSVVIASPEEVPPSHGDNRIALIIEVDLDPVRGAMHTQKFAQAIIHNILWRRVSNYKPIVVIAPTHLQPVNKKGITIR